jgi:AhpD family alkylhydroperoxidase
MTLDNQTLALIAVGASIAANCQPCLEHNVRTALQCGANSQQVVEAIDIGRRVRQGAASQMDKFALNMNGATGEAMRGSEGVCECGSLNAIKEAKNG